ncbi:hypothetical protein IMCC20628_01581 [Hoeflea sp. IMCC20628]|uniref:hypothetical protein n=1 Tax=Hoeflea sp. IMCC20628 TaxID=1620421 RepID=UPI00063AC88D|nr:hypothetical protein [Hoeflea sp. IMCC20628]AKI00297.1 hypothetical protein IMCC20628_01581 [Hoeflea sp. IMCC20628]
MFLVGLIWWVAAPLSLVAAVIAVAIPLRKRGKAIGLTAGIAVVLIPVALVYAQDRAEFAAICDERTGTQIYKTATAEGMLLASETANSFGTRYIYDEGFQWYEAGDIYNRNAWVRYQRGENDTITTIAIPHPTARYEVRETLNSANSHTTINAVTIADRSTEEVLAVSAMANFDGGRMKYVLGMLGPASCPDPGVGSGFNESYHLARDTLQLGL